MPVVLLRGCLVMSQLNIYTNIRLWPNFFAYKFSFKLSNYDQWNQMRINKITHLVIISLNLINVKTNKIFFMGEFWNNASQCKKVVNINHLSDWGFNFKVTWQMTSIYIYIYTLVKLSLTNKTISRISFKNCFSASAFYSSLWNKERKYKPLTTIWEWFK